MLTLQPSGLLLSTIVFQETNTVCSLEAELSCLNLSWFVGQALIGCCHICIYYTDFPFSILPYFINTER